MCSRACDMAMAGEVDAIVTAPLNKAAMYLPPASTTPAIPSC